MNARAEVIRLVEMGPFPAENGVDVDSVGKFEQALHAISRPVTDQEARLLVTVFGPDGFFGLASTLMHLIETAPNWPLTDCFSSSCNEWVVELRNRSVRGGKLLVDPSD